LTIYPVLHKLCPANIRREAFRKLLSEPPLLASEGWHRFVSAFCLLFCTGLLRAGLSGLWEAQHDTQWSFLGNVCLLVLGAHGCEFCLRELWKSVAASRRK